MQTHISIKNRKEQLKLLCSKVQYLSNRKRVVEHQISVKSWQSDEIDAMFWMLAQYQVLSGYDVESIMKEFEGIYLPRYKQIVSQVRSANKFNRWSWMRCICGKTRKLISCISLGSIFPQNFSVNI